MDKEMVLKKLNEIRESIGNASNIELYEDITQVIHEIESEGTRPRIVLKSSPDADKTDNECQNCGGRVELTRNGFICLDCGQELEK